MPPPPPPQPNPNFPSPGSSRPGGDRGTRLDASSIELALATFQQRIDQLQESLSQQNKLATLGMVTAVIAHEFNNILTPMISYTRFALSDKSDEPLRAKALAKALSGAERLANISKSLLGFARGDESASAHVSAAVRETLGCLARDLAKDGISLTLNVPDTLHVAMNAGHFQQVLMNLVVNARSAMLSGRAGGLKRLAIRAAPLTGGSSRRPMVEISVSDTGPGIPADILPHIFDPFFSTKRPPCDPPPPDSPAAETDEGIPRGGTGLGLTISQELLAAAEGTIRVVCPPAPEQGTTFILEIPAAPPLESPAPSATL